MSCGSCCSGGRCAGCKFVVVIVALLTTITTVATFIGVWQTHMTAEGWSFGTTNGSLAVIAFVASIMCWLKLVKKICPCGKGSCGGACSSCGTDPCSCR